MISEGAHKESTMRGDCGQRSEAVIEALEIEARYKTSFWDTLILQAAEQSGAAILYSEDLAVKQSYRTVQVVNPLAG
jgi:predicted nucleic acid-binding protein